MPSELLRELLDHALRLREGRAMFADALRCRRRLCAGAGQLQAELPPLVPRALLRIRQLRA